jgi:large subunit ribosomal protein L6
MSKIGKKPISIPSGVQIQIQEGLVSVKGPKGELKRTTPNFLTLEVKEANLEVGVQESTSPKINKERSAFWGLYRALIANMVKGVSEGFEESLEFQGVGFKAIPKGSDLELHLGYSHPILYKAPEGIAFKVEKNTIKIAGIDKEVVGMVAAQVRSKRLPEPYKGSGIRYSTEVIRRKAGKKAASA